MDRFNSFAISYTLIGRARTLRGMEDFMMDVVLRPRVADALLDAITAIGIPQLRQALPLGFDCVHFGDDWGSQKGLLIRPALWRRFPRPGPRRMFDIVRQHGLHVSVHSCGDIQPVLDEMVEMGVSIVSPFQPEPMDVWQLFERYKGRLTFHGGLSREQTLPYADVHRVKVETQRLLDAGVGGGCVFASGHGIGPEVPLDNALAMIQVLQAQPGFPGPRIA
jgi:uroporphyrinogen decarboxylase